MIYAYYRVSNSDQNYNSQKLGVEEYCKRCGYEIDKEVIDDGVSGTVKAKDRNLWKIIKEAKSGDLVITSELSRIGRSTTDVLQTLNTLSKKGVNVYFVKQGMQLDQSPMGKMMTAILSAFAEMERDLISQRTKEGLERAKREGKHVGRKQGARNKLYKLDKDSHYIGVMLMQDITYAEMARRCGCSWATLRRYIQDKYAV